MECSALYILSCPNPPKVWMVPSADARWTLPSFTWQAPDGVDAMTDPSYFGSAFSREYEAQITILFAFHWKEPVIGKNIRIYNLENHDSNFVPPGSGQWIDESQLSGLEVYPLILQSVLATWFEEARAGKSFSPVEPWCQPGWLSRVLKWVSERTGCSTTPVSSIEQVRFWQRSAVLKIKTGEKRGYYFKACPRELSSEVSLTEILARRFPRRIPEVVAVNHDENWLLIREIEGRKLNSIVDIDPWANALRDYARLQQSMVSFLPDCTACDDRSPMVMVPDFERAIDQLPTMLSSYATPLNENELSNLRRLIPRMWALCRKIEAYGVPCTFEHSDANGDNFWMTPDGVLISDWAEACIAHPFSGLVTFLSIDEDFPKDTEVKDILRAAYLGEWIAYAPLPELRDLLQLVAPVKLLQEALHFTEQCRRVQEKLDGGQVLDYSYAAWTINQVQSWVPHFMRQLLNDGLWTPLHRHGL